MISLFVDIVVNTHWWWKLHALGLNDEISTRRSSDYIMKSSMCFWLLTNILNYQIFRSLCNIFSLCRSLKSSISTWAQPSRTRFWRSCLSRSRPELVNVLASRPLLPSVTPMVMSVSVSNAPRKLPPPSVVQSFWPSCQLSLSGVASGVTRLVDPTPCHARLPVR